MDECIKYRTNIKKIVLKKYENQLNMLGENKVYITFYDRIKSKNLKDNFIFITDFKNLEESMKKIHYYLDILEKKYKVVDIFIFKMQDTVNYSDGFLASFFCISKKIYKEDILKYNKIFGKNIKDVEKVKNYIQKYLETKKRYLAELNTFDEFQANISEIYTDIAKNMIVCQEKQRKKIKKK